jgi:hypothetical protein
MRQRQTIRVLHLTGGRVTVVRSDRTEIAYSIGNGSEGLRLMLPLPSHIDGQVHIDVDGVLTRWKIG